MTISLISCEQPDDMSSYYFPFDQLEDGLVYSYESIQNESLDDENWFYKTLKNGVDTVLIGQFYSLSGRVEQLIIERRVALGVIQDSLILYGPGPDSTDIGIRTVLGPSSVFPFYKNQEDTLNYKVVWVDPKDSLQYTLLKKKVFSGDTTYLFQNNEVDALSFETFISVETFREDLGMTESEWSGREIYAKNIGLVYYSQSVSPEFTKAYRLKGRYAMQSFLESQSTKF